MTGETSGRNAESRARCAASCAARLGDTAGRAGPDRRAPVLAAGRLHSRWRNRDRDEERVLLLTLGGIQSGVRRKRREWGPRW